MWSKPVANDRAAALGSAKRVELEASGHTAIDTPSTGTVPVVDGGTLVDVVDAAVEVVLDGMVDVGGAVCLSLLHAPSSSVAPVARTRAERVVILMA